MKFLLLLFLLLSGCQSRRHKLLIEAPETIRVNETINACLDERPFVVGEMPWNYADFSTCQGPMRVGGNRKGLFTRDRRPKMAAHYFRKRWHLMEGKSIPEHWIKARFCLASETGFILPLKTGSAQSPTVRSKAMENPFWTFKSISLFGYWHLYLLVISVLHTLCVVCKIIDFLWNHQINRG